MMNLFYTPPEHISKGQLSVIGQEAVHAVKSLRLQQDDDIRVTDGAGTIYRCVILEATPARLLCDIAKRDFTERPVPNVVVAMGILKKRDRMEFAIEKGTEIGVSGFRFFRGDHSEKPTINLRRAKTTALSAMKQSLQTYLPEISYYQSLDALIADSPESTLLYTAHQDVADGMKSLHSEKQWEKLNLIIGPEGGLSNREVELLSKEGSRFVGLGKQRFRAETAAIIAADRSIQILKQL